MSTMATEIIKQIHRLSEEEQIEVFSQLREEMDETAYLNSSKANAARLDEAQRDFEAGRFEVHDLIEP